MAQSHNSYPATLTLDEAQVAPIHNPDIPMVYANNVAIAVSTWDVRITLNQIMGNDEERGPLVKPLLVVNMPHTTAKAFLDILGKNLGLYEKNVGTIKLLSAEEVAKVAPNVELNSQEEGK